MYDTASIDYLLKVVSDLCDDLQQELAKQERTSPYEDEACALHTSWYVNLYVPLAEVQHYVALLQKQPKPNVATSNEAQEVLAAVAQTIVNIKNDEDSYVVKNYLATRGRLLHEAAAPLQRLLNTVAV